MIMCFAHIILKAGDMFVLHSLTVMWRFMGINVNVIYYTGFVSATLELLEDSLLSYPKFAT